MNGAVPKRNKVRKVIVRNSITPARPCEVVQKKHVQFIDVEDESTEEEERDFSSPEFCSVLKLADEIRKVQIHPNSQLKKRELSHCSKQFNVNFEPDEKLYQDLISLEKPDCDAQVKVKISAPKCSVKKDPELDLKKILQYSLKEDYKFTRFHVPEIDRPKLEFDGFSIYRHSKRYMTYNNY